MNKYLITYDLKGAPLGSYEPLHDAIKSISGFWWHYLESTWIIKNSTKNAGEISAILTPYLRNGDRLYIVKIDHSDSQGLLPEDAWKWLRN